MPWPQKALVGDTKSLLRSNSTEMWAAETLFCEQSLFFLASRQAA
jgi:hypothetical protein